MSLEWVSTLEAELRGFNLDPHGFELKMFEAHVDPATVVTRCEKWLTTYCIKLQ